MADLTINELYETCHKEFPLEWVAGKEGGDRVIQVGELNRPGLSFAGYFEYFRAERIQIIGLGEQAYLKTLGAVRRLEVIKTIMGFPELPCVIVTHGQEITSEVLEHGNLNNIPVFRTSWGTAQLVRELSAFLENRLAPMTVVHGVLTVVYGLGLLIMGGSGSGKSECGLELVKRGHMLVADDYVEVRQHPGDILIGSSGPTVKHFIEVRGLGLIDVKQIFGISAVKDSTRLELVIRLEVEEGQSEYDRIGLEGQTTEILGVELPEIVLPLRPGRNVAVLLEVAALNHRLKQEGIFSAQEFNEKLIRHMNKSSEKNRA